MKKRAGAGTYKILSIDHWLKPYSQDIALRVNNHTKALKELLGEDGDLPSFANGYLYYGIHRTADGWVYREWAPEADTLHFMGDFNGWNPDSHPMHRLEGGVWEIYLPGTDALAHGQKVKVVVTRDGKRAERIPAYIFRAVQDERTNSFAGEIWAPAKPFPWTDGGYKKRKINPLYIYECHIGMAQEEEKIGTYDEFTEKILPRIAAAGYNAVQLMAIQEHPYYASFGYQVTNFFAASSWYGDPDGLKRLIDKAHSMNMYVLLDVVHSHLAPNTGEGIADFDMSGHQYTRGTHPAWGTKLFDYGKHEVIHFLLSNLKFWLEEYHFDGFRFDGVTSMLYHDHGLGETFDGYHKYFSLNTNTEAVTYLTLATELVHAVNPFAVTIAEDMSGMPGMCLSPRYGGIGFDYRLAMGVPDFWVSTVQKRDEDWNIGRMWYELTTRRPQEKVIGYAESHDQALVGDKTLIFWLADKEMYTGMDKAYHSLVIDRAIALHKMIRLVTLTLACNGYLNFMGNEFGHPEWIDFPREGNGWSFKYARRQWSLADNGYLKYEWLKDFDQAMIRLARKYRILSKEDAANLWMDENKKLLAYSKGGMLYLFNFHPSYSPTDFFLPANTTGEGDYQVVLSTDDACFGGQGRISHETVYHAQTVPGKGVGFNIYSPCRTGMVLVKINKSKEQ